MSIKEEQITVRGNNYQKFWIANFGISNTHRSVSIDLGNEKTILPSGETANVADLNLIMDFITFKMFVNLLNHQLKKIENEFGDIDLEEEEEKIKIQEQEIKKKQELIMKKMEQSPE